MGSNGESQAVAFAQGWMRESSVCNAACEPQRLPVREVSTVCCFSVMTTSFGVIQRAVLTSTSTSPALHVLNHQAQLWQAWGAPVLRQIHLLENDEQLLGLV